MKTFPSAPFICLYNSLFIQYALTDVHYNYYLFCDRDQSDPDLTIGSSFQKCPVFVNILNWKPLLYPPPNFIIKMFKHKKSQLQVGISGLVREFPVSKILMVVRRREYPNIGNFGASL